MSLTGVILLSALGILEKRKKNILEYWQKKERKKESPSPSLAIGTSLAVQWLSHTSTAGDVGSILDQGAKNLHAT